MTWRSKLEVDLLPELNSEKMLPAADKSARGFSLSKDALLRAILVAIVIGLIIQTAHVYLTATTIVKRHRQQIDVSDKDVDKLEMVSPLQTETIRLVIYSYDGLKGLPLGSLIADTLAAHTQVLYISDPTSLLNAYSPAFPSYKKKTIKREMEHLLSCNRRLLTKVEKAGHIQYSDCQGDLECDERQEAHGRCLLASLKAVELYQGPATELQNLFQPNETLHFVHISMDPRLYIANTWAQQGNNREMDKSKLEEIAQNYCSYLMKDRKVIQKQRNTTEPGSRSTAQRYFFLRHEDLMLRPNEIMAELFNFLELHMTEEILESIQAIKGVDLNDLYTDVHSRVLDTAKKHCSRSIEKLGYPTADEIKAGDIKMKPYNEWWREPF